ncbi:MAG TPA: hypothetical protein VK175_18405 [Leadbetterella sp.]|nr:hypothetical protein [Leadbetterella sp.]
MKYYLLIVILLSFISCQNRGSDFVLEGTWMDVACKDSGANCKSRFPQIRIDTTLGDSVEVTFSDGHKKNLWSSNKYNATTLTLEDNYETLLYPIYDKNLLAYYDDDTHQFIYYKKLNTAPN